MGCQVIAKYLETDNNLTYLFLENNKITDDGLNILIEALKKNESIMSLWLGRNHITDKGVELFSEFLLGHKNKIKEFSIGGETMTDMGAYCIAKTIHASDQIKSVQ